MVSPKSFRENPVFKRFFALKQWAFAILAVFLLLPCGTVLAKDASNQEQIYSEQLHSSGAENLPQALPEETQELLYRLGWGGFSQDGVFYLSSENLFQEALKIAGNAAANPIRIAGCIVGILVLCALLESIKTSFMSESISEIFTIICVLMISALLITPLLPLVKRAETTVLGSFSFLITFVPVYAGILIANGQTVTAGAYSATTVAAAQGATGVFSAIIMPLLQLLLSFSVVSTIAPKLNTQSIQDFLHKLVKWLLGFSMTVFVMILSLQGVAGNAADSLGIKTTKLVIGSAVPVVGSALSEAYSSIHGYVGILKSSVGAFGILAGGAIFLPTVLELMLWIAATEFCAAIGALLKQKNVSLLLKSISSVLGIFLAVLLSCVALLIISTGIVLALKPA